MANAFVQVQADGPGKKVQVFENSVGGQTVEAQATVAVDTTGAAISLALDGTDGASPPSVPGTGIRGWLRSIYDKLAGTLTVSGSVGVSSLPGSPSQDRTTAGAPASVELSDGAAFYTAAKTGQLPSALVSGRLDVNVGADGVGLAKEAGGHLASIDTKIPAQGAAATAASTPVNIAFDQTVPVSAASLPLPTGAAKESGGNLDAIAAALNNLAAAIGQLDDQAPQQGVLVQGRDNSSGDAHPLNIDGEGNVGVFTQSLPLPQGAAQEGGNLAAIVAALRGVLQVAETSVLLPPNAAQETGNLQALALILRDMLTEQRRQTVLLASILGATGNGVPDQDEIDTQLAGGTPWPQ